MIRELHTGVVACGEGVGAEDGEVLALALERGEPAARAEGLPGAEQRPVELVHRRLVVLRVNHPRDLAAQYKGSVTLARGRGAAPHDACRHVRPPLPFLPRWPRPHLPPRQGSNGGGQVRRGAVPVATIEREVKDAQKMAATRSTGRNTPPRKRTSDAAQSYAAA
jgi:hypothetical protein